MLLPSKGYLSRFLCCVFQYLFCIWVEQSTRSVLSRWSYWRWSITMMPPQVRQPTRSVPPSHHLPLPSHSHKVFQFFPPRNTFQLPHHIIALMETFSLTQGFQFFSPSEYFSTSPSYHRLDGNFLTHNRFPEYFSRWDWKLPYHIIPSIIKNTLNNHEVGHCSCWQLFITSPA